MRRVTDWLLLLLAGSCAAPITGSRGQAPEPAIADSVTFAIITQTFRLYGDSAPSFRVDPRPLITDPTLVTFFSLGDAAPPGIGDKAPESPFMSDTSLVNARRRTLERLRVSPADALDDLGCTPQRSETWPQAASCAGATGFSTLTVGLPRGGGPFAPGIVDDRKAFEGRDVVSVRVVQRTVTRSGITEFSADYVYERESTGRIVFVKRVRLFWIG